jgi:hypothetical protein
MADYLPTNTPRLRMTQTGPRGTHKMVFRVVPGTTPAGALAAVTPVIEAMLPFMISATAWASAEFAAEGSEVFLPVPFTPIVHADGVEAVNPTNAYGLYINWIGRSSAGSRAAFYLFNVGVGSMTANNRLTPAENASITALLAAFDANNTVLCAIDQNPFVLKAYGNTGINADVAKKSRALA